MRKLSIVVAMLALGMTQAHADSAWTPASATDYKAAVYLTCMQSVPQKAGKDYSPAIAKCTAKAETRTQAMLDKKTKREAAVIAREAKRAEKQAAKVAKCMTDTDCEKTDLKG